MINKVFKYNYVQYFVHLFVCKYVSYVTIVDLKFGLE